MKKETIRNILLVCGTVLLYAGNLYLPLMIPRLVMAVAGCYIWTQLKNRHGAFALLGILAPFGFYGLAKLKKKEAV